MMVKKKEFREILEGKDGKEIRERQFRLYKCGFNQCRGWKDRGCLSMSLEMCSCTKKNRHAPIRLWFTFSKFTSSKGCMHSAKRKVRYKFPKILPVRFHTLLSSFDSLSSVNSLSGYDLSFTAHHSVFFPIISSLLPLKLSVPPFGFSLPPSNSC